MNKEKAEYLLIWYLSRNESFREDIATVPYSDLFRGLAWHTVELAALKSSSLILGTEIELDKILDYYYSVVNIARKYRLPLEWGSEAIHKWAIDAVKGFAISPHHLVPVEIEVSKPEDKPFPM